MQFGACSGQILPAEKVQQKHVAPLGEIVATLVGVVDEALDAGQVLIAGFRRARHILRVPQFEVGQMLLGYRALEAGQRWAHGRGLVMPHRGAPVLQPGDL